MYHKLQTNTQIFISQNQDGILINFKPENGIGKVIHSVPSRVPFLIEEIIPNKHKKISRLILGYYDKGQSKQFIEIIDFSLHDGQVLETKSIEIEKNSELKRLAPGTYCYPNPEHERKINILSAYNHEIIEPQQFHTNYDEGILRITDVSFSGALENNKTLIEMCLHFGNEETIHTVLKVPTTEREVFQMSPYIWSEMTGKEYRLCPSEDDEYKTFEKFLFRFKNHDLAKEIAYINSWVYNKDYAKKEKIREKIQKHINKG